MTPSPTNATAVFTIGHSNLEPAGFFAVLGMCATQTVCDVRSRPGSFRFPQFNRESLEASLTSAEIHYEFPGEQLGGRPVDPRVYHYDGLVDYPACRKDPDFCAGTDRALEFLRNGNIVLLCAEEHPLQCHRFLMICPALLGAREFLTSMQRLLYTIGFSGKTAEEFFALLQEAGVEEERGVPHKLDTSSWPAKIALLCSEPGPEKCHRRLVADLLATHCPNRET